MSAIASAFGVLVSIVTALVSAVRKQGGTDAENYGVFVDYEQTLQEMITVGHYDQVDGQITDKNFPTQGSGQQNVVVELVNFGRRAKDLETVLEKLESRGFRAAMLPELLAFGATYPEKQREFRIIALGSVWWIRGVRYLPCLDRSGPKRGLYLHSDDFWYINARWAVVRK